MTIRYLISLTITLHIFILSGCTILQKQPSADLNRIYSKAASSHRKEINPVIVIPGILGSKIIDDLSGKSIWGNFSEDFLSYKKSSHLTRIALPVHGTGQQASASPDGALSSIHFRILGLPIRQLAYSRILNTLGTGGYIDSNQRKNDIDWGKNHFTCFQFSYDWRKSNAENAQALHQFILDKKKAIRKNSIKLYGEDRPNIKFNIVAHSMGGLIARYYLRYGKQPLPKNNDLPSLNWAGAKHIDQLILVGTPNSGSIQAFDELLDGKTFLSGWKRRLFSVTLPTFPPSIIGTYPSVYELLPRTRHQALLNANDNQTLDIYNPELWKQQKWGILNPSERERIKYLLPQTTSEPQREEIVYNHLKHNLQKAKQFHRSLDRPATPPKGVSISLIAGDAIATPRQSKINLQNNKRSYNNYSPGDGTVIRSSALADERISKANNKKTQIDSPIHYSSVLFLPKGHLDLTKGSTFSNNLLYNLLEKPQ